MNEIIVGLNIEHQWKYKGQETVCVWLGFFSQLTFVLVFILSYEVVVHVFCIAVKGFLSLKCEFLASKYYSVTLETVYIVLPLLISVLFAIYPYAKKNYGIAGPWCWVLSLNEECAPFGFVAQMIFYSLYMLVGIVGMAVSLVLHAVIYCKIPKESRQLLKETLYVLIFQFIHIMIIMYNLSVRLYTLISWRHQHYNLWSADAFTLPIGVLVFPFGYLLCIYPAKRMCFQLMTFLKLKQRVQMVLTEMATAPKSDRISLSSNTFIIPHPDESKVSDPHEKSPLVNLIINTTMVTMGKQTFLIRNWGMMAIIIYCSHVHSS